MDVNNLDTNRRGEPAGIMDSRQRRALARLGLATAGAYMAPTLLSLRSSMLGASAAGVGAAA